MQAGERVAEHLRQLIADQTFEEVGRVTASFGIATLESQDTEDSLIKRADTALYQSKDEGRNCVTSLHP